jgi:ATP-dependent helicase/nuclease subunit B
LRYLDSRPEAVQGDQFNYRLTRTGEVHKRCPEAVEKQAFEELLAQVEAHVQRMGREIYSGQAAVAPYRRGWVTACDQCGYKAICRIDPWTHPFRELKYADPPLVPAAEEEADE